MAKEEKSEKGGGKGGDRSFDINTVLGLVLAIGLMLFGIVFDKGSVNFKELGSFFDAPSVAIVIGGTIACLFLSYPMSQFAKIPKHMMILVMPRKYSPEFYIEQLVACAQKARVNGLLALEEDVNQMTDVFLKNSLMMVVDSVDPEKLNEQLDASLENLDERHGQDCGFYDKGAALAPAFGMIGTLIGLVKMLKNMEDTASVGPSMAVALLTTFYGSIMANVIFMPISTKLSARHEEEYLCMKIVCEGVRGIQAGENPNFIEERLMKMLPEYRRAKMANKKGGKEEKGEDK